MCRFKCHESLDKDGKTIVVAYREQCEVIIDDTFVGEVFYSFPTKEELHKTILALDLNENEVEYLIEVLKKTFEKEEQ